MSFHLQTQTLELQRFVEQTVFSSDQLQYLTPKSLHIELEWAGKEMALRMEHFVYGSRPVQRFEDFEYPADWWTAFRYRFRDRWWMRFATWVFGKRMGPMLWDCVEVQIEQRAVFPDIVPDFTARHKQFVVSTASAQYRQGTR